MSCVVKTYPKQVSKTSRVRVVVKLSTTASAYRWGFLLPGDLPHFSLVRSTLGTLRQSWLLGAILVAYVQGGFQTVRGKSAQSLVAPDL